MTVEVHAIQRLSLMTEANPLGHASYVADSSASRASFTDIPAIEGTVSLALTRDEMDPGYLQQHIDDARKRLLGKRMATLSWQMNLAPTGVAAGNGVSSVTSAVGLVLKTIMGAETLGEGALAAAGSSGAVVNVATGKGTNWSSCGRIMGWENASGVIEWREVESRSTDAITLKRAFSGTPAEDDELFNRATYSMTASPGTTLAAVCEGLGGTDRWLLAGGQSEGGIALAFDLTGGQFPRLTVNLTFATWFDSSEVGTSLGGALGQATYSNYSPIVGEAGVLEAWELGTATYSADDIIACSAMSWEPHIAFGKVTAPSGLNTIREWTKTRQASGPLSGSFVCPFEDLTHWNRRGASTDLALQYTFGVTAEDSVILSAPTIQELNPQRQADAGGFAAQMVQWTARRDEDAGGATTDLALSPLRIHL
jgi:hypothetical protein